MGFTGKEFEKPTDAAVVEFCVDIVEQKQRIFGPLRIKNGEVRDQQQKEGTSLLAGRAVFAQVVPVKMYLKIVAVCSDQGMPGRDLGCKPQFQPFSYQRFIVS